MQDSPLDAVREHDFAGQAGGGPAAGDQQLLRRGGDLQLRGITPPVIKLLPLGSGEAHGQGHRSGLDSGLGPLRLPCTFIHGLGVLGDGQPDQLVPVGFHHNEQRLIRAAVHQDVGGLGQAAGQRGDGARFRVVPAHGAVVGVRQGYGTVRQHGDAEGVLQARLRGLAVAEAEVEQAGADGGFHLHAAVVVHAQAAQRGRFGIGYPDVPVGVLGQPGGLGKPRRVGGTVKQALQPGAGQDRHPARHRVEAEDLVRSGHGHHQAFQLGGPEHIPRRRQRNGQRVAAGRGNHGGGSGAGSRSRHCRRTVGCGGLGLVPGIQQPLHAVPGHGGDRAVSEVHAAQAVVHRIRHHDVVPGLPGHGGRQQRHALGLVEACGLGRAVAPALDAVADDPAHRGQVGFQLHQAVVAGICHEEGAAGQGGYLAGEAQVSGGGLRRHVGAVPAVEGALGLMLLHQLRYERFQPGCVALTGQVRHDVAFRVQDHQRGPGTGGVRLPGHQLRVIQHRMVDLVALHGGGEGHRVRFVFELGRVDAHGHQHIGVLLLEGPQLVQHVQAVDAAEGPEIQQHDLAAEILQVQLPAAGVQPVPTLEFRGPHPVSGAHGFSH